MGWDGTAETLVLESCCGVRVTRVLAVQGCFPPGPPLAQHRWPSSTPVQLNAIVKIEGGQID